MAGLMSPVSSGLPPPMTDVGGCKWSAHLYDFESTLCGQRSTRGDLPFESGGFGARCSLSYDLELTNIYNMYITCVCI